ncbi:MAG: hypothetical protein B7Y07_09390 [Halothiobacillus sp. 24-54-40]|jgi:predicted deacetylase|nr:MAG: hypothetical protein B7Y58_07680 [Halothiobacillus sp. 35-54-62]OYZ86070.1 MAG: hypothetical protein B7Y07_09390 [Halothiobacillus sp. 24-54-40]OZA79831.1 MAG: hypothetical protein B7X64_08410 [Halothiobacillus sp. 39-53-45]HQS03504.1 polysaccharide deacetylase family protein [Halothiobacillus sp.]HQS29888.1 polysaccharide deacetylase family protein [Halothiobacillus sp.]
MNEQQNCAPAALVLHDVAPRTQARCMALLAALAPWITPQGPMPVTLLVVPRYHGDTPLAEHAAFRAWLDARIALGDEVVLHGFYHADNRPVRSPVDWVRRRVYTLEGEFAQLGAPEATNLLHQGQADLAACGWSARGFVAPAWLTSAGSIAALTPLGFDWYASRTGLINLKTGQETAATSLVWSVRAAWRRRLSQIYNTRLLARLLRPEQANTPIRLGLHPVDADWPEAVRFWQDALTAVLTHRPCAIKSALVLGRIHGA